MLGYGVANVKSTPLGGGENLVPAGRRAGLSHSLRTIAVLTVKDPIMSYGGMFRACRLALVVAVIAALPAIAADPTTNFESSTAILADSCGKDIEANCLGVSLDATRLKECLSRNQDVISPQCKANYLKALDAIQQRVAARVAVANACAREIVKLCAGSTKETSKSVPCLVTASGVGPRCEAAIGDAGYR